MKILKKTVIVAALAVATSTASYAEQVNIGDPGWTGATAIANLLAAVITEKMGGEADLIPGNNTSIYGAIDRSKGEIEVHPDIWLPNQQAYTNDLVPKGTLKLSPKSYEGNQGYCVSQDFAKKTAAFWNRGGGPGTLKTPAVLEHQTPKAHEVKGGRGPSTFAKLFQIVSCECSQYKSCDSPCVDQ